MMELLENRVGGIEKALTTFDSRLGSALKDNVSSSQHDAGSSKDIGGQSDAVGAKDGEILIDEDALQSTNQPDNAADGIGIVPLTSREDCAFFGPSSVSQSRKVGLRVYTRAHSRLRISHFFV